MSLVDIAVIFLGGYVVVIIFAALVMTLRPGAGGQLRSAGAAAGPMGGPIVIGVPNPPQRFSPGDLVRLDRKGHPLARVGEVLEGGRVRVWILEISGGPQRWVGPKVVPQQEITNNYGPLDDVGLGSKISYQY